LAYYTEFAFETEEEFFDSKEDALKSFETYLKVTHITLHPAFKKACLEILRSLAKISGNKISENEKGIINNFEKKVLVTH